jgi:hypothetical protein
MNSYYRPSKAYRDLHAFAASMDLGNEALTPPRPSSARLGRDTDPAVPIVTNPDDLAEWCRAEGISGPAAYSHAMWSACRNWHRGTGRRKATLCLSG